MASVFELSHGGTAPAQRGGGASHAKKSGRNPRKGRGKGQKEARRRETERHSQSEREAVNLKGNKNPARLGTV